MWWIVRVALDRPYTFLVLAITLLLFGTLAIVNTSKDIFPVVDIPVITTIWNYAGLPPDDMANRIVANYERALTTTVNDIEHTESQSINGIGIVKTFFQPVVVISTALSQVTAIAQTLLRSLPPGTTPPLVMIYNASSVPILQLALSSPDLSEQDLYDLGANFIRVQLATVQGAAMPSPYGGRVKQVQVDLDQQQMQAHGVSAQDVNNAIGAQNLILPAGTEKIGPYEYNIKLNASPTSIEEMNDFPVKTVDGAPVFVRDVAHVRDGFTPQTNIVHVDGKRSVLISILKTGQSSTLDVINAIKKRLPQIKASLPESMNIKPVGDQSVFVRAAINDVVREGVIAAALTALMILLFIGSWRSTIIIAISIPLSILTAIIALSSLGQTINVMTLGGLALAIGMLVDDATVEMENVNRHLAMGKEVSQAILDGAQEIATPAFVSTLCICIVFVPMFFLQGVARYLFVPMGEAVVFAMLGSYFLSRTVVPTLSKYILHAHESQADIEKHPERPRNRLVQLQLGLEHRFDRLRDSYKGVLSRVMERAGFFVAITLAFLIGSTIVLGLWLGSNFFPTVDSGQIKLHLRAHTGTRVEETAALSDKVDAAIRSIIPAQEIDSIVDNIGIPNSGINLSYSNSAPIGPADADVLVSLKPDHHPVEGYMETMRTQLAQQFPQVEFFFLPADMVSQILNFGVPAPIDVQVTGNNVATNRKYADQLFKQIQQIPGIVDARVHQTFDDPEFRVIVDRSKADELGLTQRDVATSLLISLSGSFQSSPTFWINPKNNVSYPIVTQAPQYWVNSLEDLRNIPITGTTKAAPQLLGGVASLERGVGSAVVSHYNVQPLIDIYAAVQGRDLGAVAGEIDKIVAHAKKDLPKGVSITARGQMLTMKNSFLGLYAGLAFAIILVYLLIVINFQSWTDPFIIITALPAALAGIVWMLFMTGTTLSVPALTGAIMCMGVATANSVLMVTFARERMAEGDDAKKAAIEAGFVRLRPVLMTALAMIIGMLPMALSIGEGAEQNAPLGRAVIGGLLFATLATLFFVPAVFSLIHGRRARKQTDQSQGVN
jgi:CzcA family heavy metal efflux pump